MHSRPKAPNTNLTSQVYDDEEDWEEDRWGGKDDRWADDDGEGPIACWYSIGFMGIMGSLSLKAGIGVVWG